MAYNGNGIRTPSIKEALAAVQESIPDPIEQAVTMYVCGFVIHNGEVVLITKARGRHKGHTNGLGGKVEEQDLAFGENALQYAMAREIYEEAGIVVKPAQCHTRIILHGPDYVVVFFTCIPGLKEDLRPSDEGPVKWYPWSRLPPNIVPNLSWLLPLCLATNIEFPIEIIEGSIKSDSQNPI